MKKIIASLVLGLSLAAQAQTEYNATRQDDDRTADNGGGFGRTIIIPQLAGGFTNLGGAFIPGSFVARRGGNEYSTNVLVIRRSRTVAYNNVTSTWSDILVHQGWTNVNTASIEGAFDWIANGDILTITNTVTNVNVTINAGKK